MEGFADRVPGYEDSEEDRWEEEWQDAEALGQAVFELFVTQVREKCVFELVSR